MTPKNNGQLHQGNFVQSIFITMTGQALPIQCEQMITVQGLMLDGNECRDHNRRTWSVKASLPLLTSLA